LGTILAQVIERCTGIETRVTKLGYVQRGGSPTPFDRVLATRFGVKAYELVLAEQWGHMTGLQGSRIVSVPLEEAVSSLNRLDEEIYRVAEVFFG
jgi:6-phosphofructokinase 1